MNEHNEHCNGVYHMARSVYQSEPCARTFEEDLEAHFCNGFVFSRPDFFVMGRPVVSTANHALIVNPWHRFPSSQCDCWHAYLVAGNVARAFQIVPWPLPLMSYERKNVLRFVKCNRIEQLAQIFK